MDQARLYALYETDPAPIVDFLRWLAASCDLVGELDVLDVGCGPGRLLAPLSALGWRVTGLEPDPDYADAAREKAANLPGVRVRTASLTEIEESDAYDLIAAVNGPYSYLLSAEARREAVERCARALRPGGVLFLHFSNFWWILRHYREPPEQTLTVDGTMITRTAVHEIDYDAGHFTHVDTFRWVDGAGDRHEVRKTHEMAMVDPVEARRWMRQAGLADIRTFNGYEDREPARLCGKSVLVSARKKPVS
ncbi:MAG: methyltransferase domain-containing protein [Gemmatimonadales bacterium]|jgi:SAM-dependent methyltransferase